MSKEKISFVLLTLLLTACGTVEGDSSAVVLQEVKVGEVISEEYSKDYSTNGDVTAEQYAEVATRYGGVIKTVVVEEGDYVEEGQRLLEYDKAGAQNEAELAVKGAENNLKNAQDALSNAQTAANTAKSSADQGVRMAEQTLSNTKEEVDLAVSQTESALEATEENVAEIKNMNEKSVELAQQGVTLAQIAYETAVSNRENAEATTGLSTSQLEESADMITLRVWPSVQSGLTVADELLGASNLRENMNDNFETNLKSIDPGRFNSARRELNGLLLENEEKKWSQVEEISEEFLVEFENYVTRVKALANTVGKILDDASTGTNFSEATRASYREMVSLSEANLETARQAVLGLRQSLDSNNLGTDVQLTTMRNAEAAAEASFNQAKITLESTQSQVRQAEASANLSLIGAQNAYNSALTAQKNSVKQAELALESAKKARDLTYAQQKAAVDSAQNNANAAQIALENVQNSYYSQFEVAPFAGWVTGVEVKEGQTIASSKVFLTLVQTESLKVKFNVPLEVANVIQKGDGGQVVCGGGVEGFEISWVGVVLTEANNVAVEGVLENGAGVCRVGELVKVNIAVKYEAALQVPASALVWDGEQSGVWIVDEENKLRFAEVEVIEILNRALVVQSGVEAGERVVINPNDQLREGNEVVIKAVSSTQVSVN